MEFGDWITQKFLEWRGSAYGREGTIVEFAKEVGVSEKVMSSWMKKGGKKPRSTENINKLVAKFGPEVYVILGLPVPDGILSRYELNVEQYQKIMEIIESYLTEIGAKRVK